MKNINIVCNPTFNPGIITTCRLIKDSFKNEELKNNIEDLMWRKKKKEKKKEQKKIFL